MGRFDVLRRALAAALLLLATDARAQLLSPSRSRPGIVTYEDETRIGSSTRLRFKNEQFDLTRWQDPVTGQYDGSVRVGLNPNVTLLGDQITSGHLPANVLYFATATTVTNSIGGTPSVDFTGISFSNAATHSGNSTALTKVGMALASSGTWTDTNGAATSFNKALTLSASGGETNYSLEVTAGDVQIGPTSGAGPTMAFGNSAQAKIYLAGSAFPNYALSQGTGNVSLGGGDVLLKVDGATRLLVQDALTTITGDVAMSATTGHGALTTAPITFTNLNAWSATNGTVIYCSDCTQASPCAGSSTGAFARRERGAWKCA